MTEQTPNVKPDVIPDDQITDRPSKKRKTAAGTTVMSLNFTSMIDVIFLLLIYFVVTASFTMGEGVIVANLPGCGGPGPRVELPKPKIIVALTTLGNRGTGYRIHLPGFTEAPHNFTQLSSLLSKVQHNPEKGRLGLYPTDSPVIIAPTAPVRWQHVVNAYNAAIKAKYENIVFRRADTE